MTRDLPREVVRGALVLAASIALIPILLAAWCYAAAVELLDDWFGT